MSEYERIKTACLETGTLWEDEEFPATDLSVFYHQKPPFQFVWKRPLEIYDSPTFYLDNVNFDVVAGRLGEKWMVSCLGILHQSKYLLNRLVHLDQHLTRYAGIYRFHIWWYGEWKEVLVDDRLPTVNGSLVFIHSSTTQQVWAALLEKAYAKLHGSYEGLKYSEMEDGMTDLTGGISEVIRIELCPDPKTLHNLLTTTSLVTAHFAPREIVDHQTDLEIEMNYRVCEVTQVQTETCSGVLDFVRLQRQSPLTPEPLQINVPRAVWATIFLDDRNRILDSFGYWIPFQDFRAWFSRIEIVHLDGEAVQRNEPTLADKLTWQSQMYQNSWKRGVNAGGCRTQENFFHVNPQVQVMVSSESDLLMIALSQHCLVEPNFIGFNVYSLDKVYQRRVPRTFFTMHKALRTTKYANSRQIRLRCELRSGNYLIVPTTYESRREANFTLRVFSTKGSQMQVLDDPATMHTSAIIRAPNSDQERFPFTDYVDMFLHLGDEHKTINIFELQELLEACLPNDYIKSSATLDTCRQIVLKMDKNCTGRLGLSDFKDFIYSLKYWQTVFSRHSTVRVGILRAERLREVLDDVGFTIPDKILTILVLKYMKQDGMLRFGDFVAIVLHLSRAFETYQNLNIQMSLNEVGIQYSTEMAALYILLLRERIDLYKRRVEDGG